MPWRRCLRVRGASWWLARPAQARQPSRVAALLDLPHIELDPLFHGPGWMPRDTFQSEVHRFSAGSCWVTEWQYSQVRAILAQRADLLVWLDLPRAHVLRQVIGRTVRRRLSRQVLWNANREPPLWTILTDQEHIIRWAWDTHHKTATRVAALLEEHPDLMVVRLTSRSDIERWLAGPLQGTAPRR
jgi:adenylate kinase family enzyme